jgi:hypothetical protein
MALRISSISVTDGGGARGTEGDRPSSATTSHRGQRIHVDVEVDRSTEALDGGNTAAAWIGETWWYAQARRCRSALQSAAEPREAMPGSI